ncbi:MAG: ATP-binding cassette domain-containing protein [Prevotellaceae bacterium]|jgi:ABC-2 type transport system ATP-binding protein|nr:ATP-binding cassette domain-containing protein [Prevotellaceae bacterium]
MSYILQAESIVKQYVGHRALDEVSIAVPQGSIFGLLGPNGAGKTTLIRIINRITAPDSGAVYFDGSKMKANDVYNIGYLPEERGLYRKMRVGEQALYLAQLKGLSVYEARKRLRYWFTKLDIMPWWSKKVEELSKGMAQKVQLAVTVLHEPKLLIFDEPFSGFDPINTEIIKNEILALREKGSTIIFSTHNMASVEELCDSLALINQGHCVLHGALSEVRSSYGSLQYELRYTGDSEKLALAIAPSFTVSERRQESGLQVAIVNATDGADANLLLQNTLKVVKVEYFARLTPSMHDIFIAAVAAGKSSEGH